jgi:glycine cleavage system aminomethyltransferase T
VGVLFDEGTAPARGATIRGADRDIGEVTSSVWSPRLSRPIALGYVHRDFLEPGTSVVVDGRPAVVHTLPFVST